VSSQSPERARQTSLSSPMGTLLLALFALQITAGTVRATGLPAGGADALRLGERIYREGILPSGEPVRAIVQGDIPVDGRAFTCVSCHLRSGLGSVEGRVFTPPTDGRSLSRPFPRYYNGVAVIAEPPQRPAYTDEMLGLALRGGIDPNGRALNLVMPRYLLDDHDLSLLVGYLRTLSAAGSPGVDATTIHFATVVADDADPAVVESMLGQLERYVAVKNRNGTFYLSDRRGTGMAASVATTRGVVPMRLALARWPVHGPRDGWRAQLEEHYRRGPVFALLGGVSAGDWRPVHEFCETNRIPAIFPLTPLPVISETDWYTLYISKGYQQEGEAAAWYLAGAGPAGAAPVHVLRDTPAGHALADGFDRAWVERGHEPPARVVVGGGENLTGERLRELLQRHATALLLWTGPGSIPALRELAAAAGRPAAVLLSASDLGDALWSLPDEARPFTFVAYPWRLPQDERRSGLAKLSRSETGVVSPEEHAAVLALTITEILTQALMNWRGAYVRERLLELIGNLPDQTPLSYERVSLGPDQRYASKGCYIVQLSAGPRPGLVRRSDWVAH